MAEYDYGDFAETEKIAPVIADRFEEDGELSDMEKIVLAGLLEDE